MVSHPTYIVFRPRSKEKKEEEIRRKYACGSGKERDQK